MNQCDRTFFSMPAFIGIFPKDFGVTFFNMRNGMKRTNQIFFHYDFAIMFDNSNTLFLTLTIIKTYLVYDRYCYLSCTLSHLSFHTYTLLLSGYLTTNLLFIYPTLLI